MSALTRDAPRVYPSDASDQWRYAERELTGFVSIWCVFEYNKYTCVGLRSGCAVGFGFIARVWLRVFFVGDRERARQSRDVALWTAGYELKRWPTERSMDEHTVHSESGASRAVP